MLVSLALRPKVKSETWGLCTVPQSFIWLNQGDEIKMMRRRFPPPAPAPLPGPFCACTAGERPVGSVPFRRADWESCSWSRAGAPRVQRGGTAESLPMSAGLLLSHKDKKKKKRRRRRKKKKELVDLVGKSSAPWKFLSVSSASVFFSLKSTISLFFCTFH